MLLFGLLSLPLLLVFRHVSPICLWAFSLAGVAGHRVLLCIRSLEDGVAARILPVAGEIFAPQSLSARRWIRLSLGGGGDFAAFWDLGLPMGNGGTFPERVCTAAADGFPVRLGMGGFLCGELLLFGGGGGKR